MARKPSHRNSARDKAAFSESSEDDRTIVLKKYKNRRLYHPEERQFVTLEQIRDWIREGHAIHIIDASSGEEVTQSVLLQLLLESEKEQVSQIFSTDFLHQLIFYQGSSLAEFFKRYLPMMIQSYMDWQNQAKSYLYQWTQMGLEAQQYSKQYSKDWIAPFNTMNNPFFGPWQQLFTPQNQNDLNTPPASEIEALKQKIEALEAQLQKKNQRKST